MKTVLFVNQKGGVGKSTLADELAFSFEADGIPYVFTDLDQQGGTLHAGHADPGATVRIIDTPGALTDDYKKLIPEADVIIVPTRPTSKDIPALQTTLMAAQKLRKKGATLSVIINGWNRYTAARDFADYITNTLKLSGNFRISQSDMLVQAAAFRISIFKRAPRSAVAHEMDSFLSFVYRRLGFKYTPKVKENGNA